MPGVKGTMDEFKAGKLHSGSKNGPVVKSRKQAIAIGLSEERKAEGEAEPGSKEHKKKFIGKAIQKAHKQYAKRFGGGPAVEDDENNTNPFNSQR